MAYARDVSTSSADPSVARLASDLLEQVDSLAEELATLITNQIETYGAGAVVERAELMSSLIDNLTHILGQLSGTREPDLQAPRRIGRARAARDVPLPELLRAYRLGFTFVWQRLLDAARRTGEESVNALLDTATTIWELADDYSLALTDSYRQAMSERLIAADRRRSGIVSAILDGPGKHSAWEVAKLLDLPYEGTFLVLVTDARDERSAALPALGDRLRSLDVASAWRSQPDHEVGVLSLGRRRDPSTILHAISNAAIGRAGVSPIFKRLDGATRALRLAQVAFEALPAGAKAVRQLNDEPQIDFLVRDRDATRRFVLRVLGNVLALPDDDRTTLLATARAWIEAHGSAPEASRVLYCHENTVRHRIRRLEQHLGSPLDDPRNLGDLTTALQAIHIFPELANRPTDTSSTT